ncbi:aldose 1-epimerase family protein [Flavobacterium sp.]|uniref:aldose 1-epimerase family protein n=1 Tax=Flavobacterium sp. TaxID=239 RepID=UPI0039E71375
MTTTIYKSGLTATINTKGAELVSLRNDAGREYIWNGNPDFWGKHSPVLFPIVGTLKNNSYRYDGSTYNLSRHGFARDMEFEITSQTESKIIFSLRSSTQTLKVYPFEFELRLIYSIDATGLQIGYKVWNRNKEPMPFSIGAHPAFALAGDFEDYSLFFSDDESLEFHLLENDLVSDETENLDLKNGQLPLDYKLFENDALVFKTFQSDSVTIQKNDKPMVKVSFPDFPHLGLWTKKDAPFLCIEPWFGYADTPDSNGNLFEKEGIQILAAGGNFETNFRIDVF